MDARSKGLSHNNGGINGGIDNSKDFISKNNESALQLQLKKSITSTSQVITDNLNKKSYYRRTLIGIKKGLSVNTLPPKTVTFMYHPVIRIFRIMGSICMVICVSNRLFLFNTYIKYVIVIIFILYILFMLYISIVRLRYIRMLLKTDIFDVRNSPLDR